MRSNAILYILLFFSGNPDHDSVKLCYSRSQVFFIHCNWWRHFVLDVLCRLSSACWSVHHRVAAQGRLISLQWFLFLLPLQFKCPPGGSSDETNISTTAAQAGAIRLNKFPFNLWSVWMCQLSRTGLFFFFKLDKLFLIRHKENDLNQ